MRKILTISFLLTFISFPFFLTAQKPVVKISPEMKLSKKLSFDSHLHSDASGHYIYFSKLEGSGFFDTDNWPVLEKYDQKFNLVFSKKFELDEKNTSSHGIRYFKGRFIWLVSETKSDDDYIKFFIIPIDLKGKKKKQIPIAKFKYERKKDRPEFNWAISRDSSKLSFQAYVDNDDDDLKASIYYTVLDSSLTTVWSNQFKLAYTQEQFELMNSLVQNDGSSQILAKIYEGEKAKESKRKEGKRVPAYDIMLFSFSKDSKEPKVVKLELGESFIRGAAMTMSDKNELKCAGFNSTTRSGSLQGMFFMALNPDGTVQTASKKAFSAADLKAMGKDNTEKNKEGEVGLEDRFKFTNFLLRPDGSAVIVAEQNYLVTRSYYNGRTWTYYTVYYSNDIVAANTDVSGNISRVSVIPKYQSGSNNLFISHAAIVNGDDIVFFYNEDEDNLEKPINNPKPKPISSFKDAVTVMTVLKPDGKMIRKKLFEATELNALFAPNDSRVNSANDLFFIAMKPKVLGKSNFSMGTVTIGKE